MVDLADEHRGDQEQRDQRRGVEAVVDDQRDADQGGAGQHGVQQRARCAGRSGLEPEDDREPVRAPRPRARCSGARRRPGRGWRAGRRARRRPPPWRRRGRSTRSPRRPCGPRARGSSGRTAASAATPASGNRKNAGHHVDAGDDPQRTGREDGADRHPGALPQQRADLVGVVVDPVEHLADRLLGERRQRLVQGGVEQVGAQPALGAVDDTRPQRASGGVEHRGADHAGGEQPDEGRRGVLGQLSRDQRAEGGADGGDRAGNQRDSGHGTAQPPPVHGAAAVRRRWRGCRHADGPEIGRSHRLDATCAAPTVVAWFSGDLPPLPAVV